MAIPESNVPGDNDKSNGSAWLEDIEWLSTLSEPELDFLISLKDLAIKRAKNAGYKDLGDKFDLRLLRALGFILLEFFKERVRNTSEVPDSAEILRLLNQCGLCSLNVKEKSDFTSSVAVETNAFSIVTPLRKRMWEGQCEETMKRHKRQKLTNAADK
ncbi:uncharacterized protein A4U43_C01F9600 [Asparagus officinalis]|uniref:Gamma-tubulin complex component n=1 Tax=Asparagus officinalis TaxID=4686 RepID=A0A5P1FSQ2_ASPOF|nr:uncharacterized protein LOC109820234 [Asparagus officinalis]XP_020241952.1 uncharacterized protein LOC109820234 [Asparagus officinalis]XP_020241959.1 uncharacterized protein LOC109820234 [Asparagus officinalis]ONK79741.1 uncharacterized protein A4U43_C01F9600 [Asparagus officinalis]